MIESWQYVSEWLNLSRPVCADALQGESYVLFSEDKNGRVSVVTFWTFSPELLLLMSVKLSVGIPVTIALIAGSFQKS